MAGFCTKCGSPLSSATGFCNSCGAPIAAAAAPQPPIATAPQPPVATAPPAYSAPPAVAGYPPQNAYPPPKSSGGALKVILIVVAVFVVIGLGVVAIVGYGAWKVSHAIKLDASGNGGTVSLPGVGSISAGNTVASEADLGVPLYPGATTGEGGMHMTLPTGSMVTAVYLTADPVSSVVAFYKGKLGANESDIDTANGSVLSSGSQGANGKSGTEITIAPGSGSNSGKTQIVIVHTASTSTQ
jgi:hypothetical protein